MSTGSKAGMPFRVSYCVLNAQVYIFDSRRIYIYILLLPKSPTPMRLPTLQSHALSESRTLSHHSTPPQRGDPYRDNPIKTVLSHRKPALLG